MGRATIIGGGPDGLYSVSRDFGSDRAALLLAAINARIDDLDPQIDAARAAYEAKRDGEAELITALEAANEAFATAYRDACTWEGWEADPVQDEYDALRANLLAIAKQIDRYDAAVRRAGEAAVQLEQLEIEEKALKLALDAAESALETATSDAQKALEDYLGAIVDLGVKMEACQYLQDFSFECYAREYYAAEKAQLDWQEAQYVDLPAAQAAADQAAGAYQQVLAEIAQAEGVLATAEATQQDAEEQLAALRAEAADLRAAYQAAVFAQRAELQACNLANFKEELDALTSARVALTLFRAELDALYIALRSLEGRQQTLYFERDRINALAGELTRESLAWCADLTEDGEIGAEVATLEIPGEPAYIVLAPECRAPTEEDDGQVIARAMMTPAQAYYNAAILPGWQKWKPTYRIGVITAIDYEHDTASVELEEARSSATALGDISPITGKNWGAPPGDPAGLPINLEDWPLVDIPVEYMDCNASAFEVEDRVVVECRGRTWGLERVIGFADNPRGCCQDDPCNNWDPPRRWKTLKRQDFEATPEDDCRYLPEVRWDLSDIEIAEQHWGGWARFVYWPSCLEGSYPIADAESETPGKILTWNGDEWVVLDHFVVQQCQFAPPYGAGYVALQAECLEPEPEPEPEPEGGEE